jgi:hypothetical protein
MVINPRVKLYLLDADGRILDFSAPPVAARRSPSIFRRKWYTERPGLITPPVSRPAYLAGEWKSDAILPAPRPLPAECLPC